MFTKLFSWIVGLVFVSGTIGVSMLAVAALLGIAHPALDFFNHLQPLLFLSTLGALVLASVFISHPRWRSFAMAMAATGFLSSAVIVVPELVSAFTIEVPLPADGRPTYKLMTHNLFGRNYDRQRVAAAIAKEDPDILTLQEYFWELRQGLHEDLLVNYPHFVICRGVKRQKIAVYAKFPFELIEGGECAEGKIIRERTARIVAKFGGGDVPEFSVVTTHLDWPAQISGYHHGTSVGSGIQGVFARQRRQFEELADALTKLPGPLLLAADFNATSWSSALDSFEDVSGLTRYTRSMLTYPTQYYIFGWRDTIPFLPLDHVMGRGGIELHEIRAGDPAGSDHRPVIAEFSVMP